MPICISLSVTRLVPQQADTCEAVSSSGFDDLYAMDCLLCSHRMPARAPCPRSLPQKTPGPNRHTCISCGPIRHILAGHPEELAARGSPKSADRLSHKGCGRMNSTHYTTISSMWGRTQWSCGKSKRCGQAIYPETFVPDVPKIVLIS